MVDEFIVYTCFKFEHPCDVADVDDDVIESITLEDDLVVSHYLHLEQETLLFPVAAGQDLIQRRFEIVGRDVGEETQASDVDAYERDMRMSQ